MSGPFGFGHGGGLGRIKHGAPVPTVDTLTLSPAPASIAPTETHQLTYTLTNSDTGNSLGRVVTWTTSAAGVATVSATGLVTGVGAGSCTITATHNALTATADFTVVNPAATVDHVTVLPATFSVQEGSTVTLTPTAYDASNNVLQGKTFTWASADTNTATVAAGVVTGVAAGGPVNITATETGDSVVGTSAATVVVPGVYNEPAGTTLVTYHDGTTLRPSPWGTNGWWLPPTIPNPDGIAPAEVVVDADFPRGQALQLNFPRTMTINGPQISWSGSAVYSTWYIRIVFKLHPQWTWHSTSGVNKVFYFTMQNSGGGGFVVQGISGNVGRAKVFDNAVGAEFKEPSPGLITRGVVHTVEMLMTAQSSAAASDGHLNMWVDGTHVTLDRSSNYVFLAERTDVRWVPTTATSVKFKGVNWHAYWGGGGASAPKPVNEWIRVGELYISGIV